MFKLIQERLLQYGQRYRHDEEKKMREAFSGYMCPDQRISVLAFHPTPAGGELLDIGARADDWPQDRVVQSVQAGSTGSFVRNADDASRLRLRVSKIEKDVQEDFANESAQSDRRAQVALERRRYPNLAWDDPDRPPQGASIGHLSIAPAASSLRDKRIPVLGVVYLLDASEEAIRSQEDDAIHASLFAAKKLLQLRAGIFLCLRDRDSRDLLQQLAQTQEGQSLTPSVRDFCHRLATSFVLSHHWFYPYDPVCARLIQLYGGSELSLTEVFELHGWSAPSLHLHSADEPLNLNQLLDQALRDLASVLKYSFDVELSEFAKSRLLMAIGSAILRCAGNPLYLAGRTPSNPSLDKHRLRRTSSLVGSNFALIIPRGIATLDEREGSAYVFSNPKRYKDLVSGVISSLGEKDDPFEQNGLRDRYATLRSVSPLPDADEIAGRANSKTSSHQVSRIYMLDEDHLDARLDPLPKGFRLNTHFPYKHSRCLLERFLLREQD
ncbi:MAG: hypothetical protein SX243_06605 [Acidobacteriota bacterium]|nr:hypothetical protein [Acidobacteriota bacterium]